MTKKSAILVLLTLLALINLSNATVIEDTETISEFGTYYTILKEEITIDGDVECRKEGYYTICDFVEDEEHRVDVTVTNEGENDIYFCHCMQFNIADLDIDIYGNKGSQYYDPDAYKIGEVVGVSSLSGGSGDRCACIDLDWSEYYPLKSGYGLTYAFDITIPEDGFKNGGRSIYIDTRAEISKDLDTGLSYPMQQLIFTAHKCTSNDDCAEDEICYREDELVIKDCTPIICEDGEIINHECVETQPCQTDQDCIDTHGENFFCKYGVCYEKVVVEFDECQDEGDCEEGYSCVNSSCVEASEPPDEGSGEQEPAQQESTPPATQPQNEGVSQPPAEKSSNADNTVLYIVIAIMAIALGAFSVYFFKQKKVMASPQKHEKPAKKDICKRCGAKLIKGDGFCRQCGTSI